MQIVIDIITYIYILILIFCIYTIFTGGFSEKIKRNEITIKDKKVKNSFKIVLITDCHSSKYLEKELPNIIKKEEPDLVFLTGDIVDTRVSLEIGKKLVESIAKLSRIYYVTGNHEAFVDDKYNIKDHLKKMGIKVLDGIVENISVNGNNINIYGYDDRSIGKKYYYEEYENIKSQIENVNENELKLLLSHRPEKDKEYKELKADYVFSGHAHGGQWRLYKNAKTGFYAPGQGFFPKYIDGVYKKEGYTQIISAGLAKDNTKIPRIFNRPSYEVITFLNN